MTKFNELYVATSFSDIPMLAHRFYIPNLQSCNRNKEWSNDVLQKCREFLVNETCNIHIKGNLSAKILPCSIGKITDKYDLVAYLKKNQLHYGESINETGDVVLLV